MSVIDELIFDRTENDLYNDTDKAYISYTDLNRIETAVKLVSELLNQMGYRNTTNNKQDWDIRDIRTEGQAERIMSNYQSMKNAYNTFNLPDFEWASINEANDIERILFDIYNGLRSISNNSIKSNVARSGSNRIWQQRFRRGSNISKLSSKVGQYDQPWLTTTSPSAETVNVTEINDFTKISTAINSWNEFLNSLDSEVGNIGNN